MTAPSTGPADLRTERTAPPARRTAPLRDLAALLRSLDPLLREGEYVVCTAAAIPEGLEPFAVVREDEGVTLVVGRSAADAHGLRYDFVARCLTLRVHSALDAVGLTAAVSTALADAGISCNVLAGFHHDHLLVPADRADDALKALQALAR